MHLKFSHFLAILLTPLILQCQSQLLNSPNIPNERFYQLVNSNNSSTRLKRQLFREDIPQHRPLSGNHYASQHGFPHPGRWADGVRNPYKPSSNLPKPHQHYIDMLDTNNAVRKGRYQQGLFGGSGGNSLFGGNEKGVSPFGEVHGNDGDFGFGFNEDDHYNDEYEGPSKGYRPPSHVNVQVHGNKHVAPIYDPPRTPVKTHQHHHHHQEQPKAIVHYHPIQYSQVLNFPEVKPQTYGPPTAPLSHQSLNYGPPNHVSGIPLGLEGGFVPSKGIAENHHYSPPPNKNHHNQLRPYRFEPFKIFSHPPSPLEHEGPVAIPPILEFHAKPIKVHRLKDPIHIYTHSNHHNHRRPSNFFHNFRRRPKLPPPNHNHQSSNEWFHSHGL